MFSWRHSCVVPRCRTCQTHPRQRPRPRPSLYLEMAVALQPNPQTSRISRYLFQNSLCHPKILTLFPIKEPIWSIFKEYKRGLPLGMFFFIFFRVDILVHVNRFRGQQNFKPSTCSYCFSRTLSRMRGRLDPTAWKSPVHFRVKLCKPFKRALKGKSTPPYSEG